MIPSFPLLGRTFTIYPLMALVGMFASGIYACRSAKRAGQNEDDMIVLLLVSSLGVFLGMHLLYGLVDISQWPQLLAQIHSPASFFQVMATIWGGSVFYGGLLGGILAGAVYLRRKGRPLDLWASLTAPAIPLFHVFGRVGCFLGGCCYGLPSAWGFVYRYSPVAEANGVSRFPVQLVEAAWNLVLFLLLARLQRRGRDRLLPLYLALYAPARFLLEFLRGDAYRGIFLGLSTSQWISLFLFPAALYALLRPRN